MTANVPDRPRDPVVGPNSGPDSPFPLRMNGKVVKGFGRGSGELGIPTANIPLSGLTVGGHDDVESGVYYGWAGLSPTQATRRRPANIGSKYELMARPIYDALAHVAFGDAKDEKRPSEAETQGAVYPMVMSIGWNPFYKNTVRSVEVHILHHFDTDFYGCQMNVNILGFIRPEYDYVSKEKLIEDIKTDIDVAGRSLGRPAYAKFRKDPYLLEFAGKSEVGS